jgi:hypothetical protein
MIRIIGGPVRQGVKDVIDQGECSVPGFIFWGQMLGQMPIFRSHRFFHSIHGDKEIPTPSRGLRRGRPRSGLGRRFRVYGVDLSSQYLRYFSFEGLGQRQR